MESTDMTQPVDSVFGDPYFKETQIDIWNHERKKTMKSIFIISVVLFGSDLLALSMANLLTTSTFIYILIVPLIFVGLGFWARNKPVLSVIITIILFAAIIALNIYAIGIKSIISGLIVKAVVVFLFISAYQHAREAEEAKQKLSLLA